eukprot:jgi/Chlat1/1555/Chrsp122S01814
MRVCSTAVVLPQLLLLAQLWLLVSAPTLVAAASTAKVLWLGGLTSDSVTVKATVSPAQSSPLTLVYSQDASLASGTTSVSSQPISVPAPASQVHKFQLTKLQANTVYYYAMSGVDNANGRFTTTVADGLAASFKIGLASCASTGSNRKVFESIAQEEVLLFLHMGDLHYEDINSNDQTKFVNAYLKVFESERQASLWKNTPIAYMYDDHDYGTNNADATSPSHDAAIAMYRAFVPYYSLGNTGNNQPNYQAFTIGRVRFILTDLRAARTPENQPQSASKTMLGATQLQWLKDELSSANKYSRIVWMSTVPWVGNDGDGWSQYANERQSIVDFVNANNLRSKLLIVAGDAHMVAFDDGSNSPGNIPVFQAAALVQYCLQDRLGSCKGGPYSHGIWQAQGSRHWYNWFPSASSYGGGQYGILEVIDNGENPACVRFVGRSENNGTFFTYDTCAPSQSDTQKCGRDLSQEYYGQKYGWPIGLLGGIVLIACIIFCGVCCCKYWCKCCCEGCCDPCEMWCEEHCTRKKRKRPVLPSRKYRQEIGL